ncbi:MAG: prolyl oligopeptidase family serine peptidase [Candidatus Hydrogenedentes bacterium]|nr:prolyl oligopeptidase family serine peptidase [Candidatus Hydrogenedentota bacterium]
MWYAPTFIGQHPDDSHTWMATQLLERGFSICGVEVGESYGSPKGRARYSEFFNIVTTEFGLDRKACLLPQSRGGLMLLNWAAEHADQVQCIAGIYTVCNIESYPGVDKASGAYEMDPETLRAKLGEHNPIERVKPLADAKAPMLFIHGDSDTVVPIEKNAGEYVSRSKQMGGVASIIVVPGKGHEVCPEFFQSQPFTDFILSKGAKLPGS